MTRLAAVLVASVAALFTAPAALAATFTVNDPGTTNDAGALAACTAQPSTAGCTLPAAITASNTTAGTTDTINFTVSPGPFTTGDVPAITDQALVDGGGSTTITFDAAAAGPLLDVQADNTTLKALTVTGGASGPAVNLANSGDRLDTLTVTGTPGPAVKMGGSAQRVDGSRIDTVSGAGILVTGANATIATTTIRSTSGRAIDATGDGLSVSSPDIAGAGGDGIALAGNGARVTSGTIHDNGGNGVSLGGQNNVVSHVTLYGNGGKPIAGSPGANGGISPPAALRIGPRRADGSLPLTGNASGSVELWSGDPSTHSAPSFLDTISAGGDFTYNFPTEPQPGAVFAASVTGGSGTSEFATVAVPADVVSPDAAFARALDTQNVRVDFTEPLDPASVQKEDFKLTMAGVDQPLASATVSPDGSYVTLATVPVATTSRTKTARARASGWRAGEAGYVDFTGAGAVTDAAGNAMLTTPRLRVAAAPGDFLAPLGGKLAVTPRTICLTRGRNCRKPGMTIKFTTTEAGKATLLIKRSNVTVGKRLYGNVVAGPNTLKFNGRLGARKLRAGRYRLLIFVQDQVGNITDQPPIVLFSVRRVTK